MGKKKFSPIDADAALKNFASHFPSSTLPKVAVPDKPANDDEASMAAAPKPPPVPKVTPSKEPLAVSEQAVSPRMNQNPVEREHTLVVRIPKYVGKGVRIAAAKTGKTQREIVLEALKNWGVFVKDDDIVDRRMPTE